MNGPGPPGREPQQVLPGAPDPFFMPLHGSHPDAKATSTPQRRGRLAVALGSFHELLQLGGAGAHHSQDPALVTGHVVRGDDLRKRQDRFPEPGSVQAAQSRALDGLDRQS
jgi:hypothetical protein